MESFATFAFGVQLHLAHTADGGRKTKLMGGHDPSARFKYRPNWGLPGIMPPDQTGAPVFGFSRENVAPGEIVRVVIVPIFPVLVPGWSAVGVGTELPMYEGLKVCGVGRVLWREDTLLPLPADDEMQFLAWLGEE